MAIRAYRQFIFPLAGAAILLLLILYQSGAFVRGRVSPGTTPLARPGPGPAELFTVRESEIPATYRTVGTVRSRDQVEIAPRIIARIVSIPVRSGDRVKKGDLLAKLDDRDLQAVAAQARERVAAASAGVAAARQRSAAAQSGFDLARTEAGRVRELHQQGMAAQQNLDQAENALRQAEAGRAQAEHGERAAQAELAAAEQGLEQARATLAHAAIESPMDGVVAERLADPGDLASPGQILMRLFDPARLMLEAPVRESLVQAVKLGAPVDFAVPALGRTMRGEVREIVPAVDPDSRTFLIKICVGEAPGLIPGMYGTTEFALGRAEKALLIPASAIIRTGQLEAVTEVVGSGARRRFVRTVPAAGDMRRVIAGLSAGMVIAKGNYE